MVSLLRGIGRRLRTLVDDLLPVPPDQREAREWVDEPSEAQSARRRLRLRLHRLEKRGKGGYR